MTTHSIEEIRDTWLRNRGQDGSDWEQALKAVYDLGMAAGQQEQNRKRAEENDTRGVWEAVFGGGTRCPDGEHHVPTIAAQRICLRCDLTLRRISS